MSPFSPTDAALEGFRITRERPWAVCAWAALYLGVGLFSAWLMIVTVGPNFAALQAASTTPDPAVAAALFEKLAPYYAVVFPLALVFQSVMICAVYRAALEPQALTRGYLKVGREELRMLLLNLALVALASGVLFVLLFIDGLIVEVLSRLAGPSANPLGVVIVAASLCVLVWMAVRLSLAGPMTFMTGEVHIFRAWALTRGHFWALFGAYALAACLAVVVLLLAMICFLAVAGAVLISAGGSIGDIARTFQPEASSIKVYFTPAMILYQVFASILTAVIYAVILSPPAVAYAALSGQSRTSAPPPGRGASSPGRV